MAWLCYRYSPLLLPVVTVTTENIVQRQQSVATTSCNINNLGTRSMVWLCNRTVVLTTMFKKKQQNIVQWRGGAMATVLSNYQL